MRKKSPNFYSAPCNCCGAIVEPHKGYWSLKWTLHPECYEIWFPESGKAPRKQKKQSISPLAERCSHCLGVFEPQTETHKEMVICDRCYPMEVK